MTKNRLDSDKNFVPNLIKREGSIYFEVPHFRPALIVFFPLMKMRFTTIHQIILVISIKTSYMDMSIWFSTVPPRGDLERGHATNETTKVVTVGYP